MAETQRKRLAAVAAPKNTLGYERDKRTNIWSRPGFAGITYSDGDESERALLEFLKRTRDISTNSDELTQGIEDWVREAHLSPARSNLLRPLSFKGVRRVLELGAGCGAITRYLGEQRLQVDAVEGSRARAAVAAERCRDLPDVRVFAEELSAFKAPDKYDVVTLIGVLEYARVFSDAPDPVLACLEVARSHLAEEGVLVLAIENQLGLKYFNGCAEDHLGTPYSGITDLYARKTAVTFGKLELESKLREAGFARVDWSYPFPDYKLPTSVVSTRALADPEFSAGDMLIGEFSRDYGGSTLRAFDESSVWSVLERNGLLGDFANSFLVLASIGERNPLDDGTWLACRYAPQRLKPFAVQTCFARDGEALVVSKQLLEPGTPRPATFEGTLAIEQRTGEAPYVRGRLFARDFMDAVARGYSPHDLAAFIKPWVDYLAARSTQAGTKDLGALKIPGEYLDCIPTNLIVDERGALQPIDLEFVVPHEIPLAWVVLRGVVHLAAKCFGHRAMEHTSFRTFLDEILPALGFANITDWQPFFELEDSLIRTVLRPWRNRPPRDILRARVELPIAAVHSLHEAHAHLAAIADIASRPDLAAFERSHALVADFGRWLGLLPDPGTSPELAEVLAQSPELLELSDRIAQALDQVGGGNVGDRIRDLATQRARWAAMARDNQRLAWDLDDAHSQVEAFRIAVSARELKTREATRREREATQSMRREEARAEALKGEVDVLKLVVSAREEALKEQVEKQREATQAMQREETRAHSLQSQVGALQEAARQQEGAGRALEAELGAMRSRAFAAESTLAEIAQARGREQGRAEVLDMELSALQEGAQKQMAAAQALRSQLDAANVRLAAAQAAVAREEGRASGLREELKAVKQDAVELRGHLDNAMNRLKRRGAEVARVHRHLREAGAARAPAAPPPPAPWYARLWRAKPEAGAPQPSKLGKEESARLEARAAPVAGSGLFDADAYLRQNPEVRVSGEDPLIHYLRAGWSEGRNPNPLFHEAWYRAQNADTLEPGESGLEHYLREGSVSGRWPNPLFDAEWYLDTYPDVRAHLPGPLHHYLVHGVREARDPHPLFDTDWFLSEYRDAATIADRVNPLAYFLEMGPSLGHSPCELFNSEWYLSEYPDIEATGQNPLLHYLERGAHEGRDPSDAFDTKWYLESNPDVAATGMNPLLHYRISGMREGRLPMPRRKLTAADITGALLSESPATDVMADGVREWEDYEPLKQRVELEARQALRDVNVVAPEMLEIDEGRVDRVLASLAFPVHDAPRVSIVIPAYNKLAMTLECLESIAMAGSKLAYEVIVADDGSPDGTGERLAQVPGLVVQRNAENRGFLLNCNGAFPLARGEFVVLLNNDVQVTRGWLDALVETFDEFEGVGAVGPKLIYPSGHLQEAGVALRVDGSVEMVGLNDDPKKERYNYARPVDYVSGACLVMRTALLVELGGFSEDFLPCYCEDADLCMRIRQRGLSIVYQPAATVVHHLSRTTADANANVKAQAIAGSLARFASKWQEELDRLSDVRVLAFYLPQFHPIPENDHWWGPGFTEWANVTRARPNFVGHYQPRLPADLGFYDLRVPEAMQAQADLALRYGVHGLCCYYYWFAGKRLLDTPIERMLATGKPDIPYCLCWANENWTRRWDGEDNEVLIAQKYSPEDDEAVILDLIRHFRNGNYIRVNGRPLLLVYRVSMFPDFRATADRWREACRREGVGEIYLAMVESFDLVHAGAHPADYNCDASVEFPPLGMAQPRPPSGPVTNPDFIGHVADYRDIAARFCARPIPAYTRLRGVMPGWDNTARRQNNGFCFEHSTPGAFQAWLEAAIGHTRAQQQGDERIVFVNAWNEWAEGAYLEPDRRFGHAFLEAVRNAKDAQRLLRMGRYALDIG